MKTLYETTLVWFAVMCIANYEEVPSAKCIPVLGSICPSCRTEGE